MRGSIPYFVILLLLFLFFIAYMFHRIVVTVEAGEAGVLFRRFSGTDIDNIYKEGLYIVWPWNILNHYSVRVQERHVDIEVLSQDGLNIEIVMSIRFRPTRRLLGTLHQYYGPNYVDTYVIPELESSVRRIIGTVKPQELYASARDSVEAEINNHLHDELREFDEFTRTNWPVPTEPEKLASSYPSASAQERIRLNEQLIISHLESGTLQQQATEMGLDSLWQSLKIRQDSLALLLRKEKRHYDIASRRVDDLDSLAALHRHEYLEPDSLLPLQQRRWARAWAHRDSMRVRWQAQLHEYRPNARQLAQIERQYDRFFMLVDLHDVLIKRIKLPPKIEGAIQSKLQQEQIAQEFDFRLIRERKEAERKRIEARGIRDFQDTISTTIKAGLLRWKAIEATLELAKSNNSKVIVIGAGEQGLPIILGNESYAPAPVDTTRSSPSEQTISD